MTTLPVAPNLASRVEVIDHQRRLVHEALHGVIGGSPWVAVLDWPDFANVGDSAIWAGTMRALHAIGAKVRSVASQKTYDPRALDRALGSEGVILLQGGGNLGDLWPNHELHRARILADFPHRAVVQLSQSIHFDDLALADATGRRLRAHPRYHLLVRDRRSEEFARRHFGCPATLVPDMAFGLGPLERTRHPVTPVTWMSRRDKEHPGEPLSRFGGLESWDWTAVPTARTARWLRRLSERTIRHAGQSRWPWRMLASAYDRLAEERLRFGLGRFSEGRVAVTNRLHGHILCLLADIPQFVSDSRQGKVRAYYDTWTHDTEGVTWCTSEEAALAAALAAGKSSPC